jgi:hypothetical protein
MSDNITPLEWLWRELEQRLGADEVKALREQYKAQLRQYQKRLKEEEKAREEERRRNPGPHILG